MSDDSTIVEQHVECTINGGCGSSDGMCSYDDGHKFCFACEEYEGGERKKVEEVKQNTKYSPLKMSYSVPLKARKIDTTTMRKFDYGQGKDRDGSWVHITNLRDEHGSIVGQKIRDADKNFSVLGSQPKTFWGQHLFDKGKKLVITEGEIDCMSVSLAFENKYPVVSLPNGTNSAKRTIKAQLEWLDRFEEVIICFDNDDPGNKAAKEAALLLPPGRAKIAKLSRNDPNKMLQDGMTEELKRAIYDAKVYRPDTIKSGDSLRVEVYREMPGGAIPFGHTGLEDMLRGCRLGEITLIGAGSGVGKTTVIKELLAHNIRNGDRVGGIFLEENNRRTVQGLATCFVDYPVHMKMIEGPGGLSVGERTKLDKALDKWIIPNVDLFDNTILSPEDLLRHVRYMKVSLGCNTLVLDHITMLANLAPDGQERTLLDNTMNKLAALIHEIDARMFLVSHLKRPAGTPHEEGAQVRVGDFRGSTQIACLSHNIIGIERNQQHPTNRDYTRLRVLKCRVTGFTGVAGWMHYNAETGRMLECDEPEGGFSVSKDAADADPNEAY